ncbi:MAG: translocation/assembly module TamB domain-containing protein [Dysgonomonas sp.]
MTEEQELNSTSEKPKKKSFTKRLFRIFLYIVLGFIGLNVLLFALLSIPAVQKKVADFAVDQLKSTLKTEVSIDEVRLKLFNKATLKGIYIEDQSKDTLLYAHNLEVRLSPWEFIKSSKLAITGIDLDDFVININQKDSVSNFNFQFIIDAFSSSDTTQTDTTKSSLKIIIENISIKNGRLNYDILSDSLSPGLFNSSHISLYDMNANLDLNSIDTDNLDIALKSLKTKEKSGIEITELKGHIFSDKSQFWAEGLSLELPNSHLNVSKARYNLNSKQFEIETTDSEIEGKDLIAFLPNLKFLKNKIALQTSITGVLPAIDIENINLSYGEDAIIRGKASIGSYERYGNSDINLSIDQFKVSPAAVTAFARLGDSTFVSPDILTDMGDIYLKGKLGGQLNKFKLEAETWCRQGAITLFATGSIDTTFTNFNVTSSLQTQNFNLGRLLGEDIGLRLLTANIDLKARQGSKTPLEAVVQGKINAIGYEKDVYRDIPFSAFYNTSEMGVKAEADLPVGKIMANAAMTQERIPDVSFRLRIDDLLVNHFYKGENWENPHLTVALNGNIKSLDIDQMVGIINVDSLHLRDDSIFDFKPGKFTLELGRDANEKFIALTSSLLSANIRGQYTFMSIADEFTNLMHNYLPNVFQTTKRVKKAQNDFTFNITANNTEELGKILTLPVDIIEPARIDGRINTIAKQIDIKGNIPYLRFGDYDVKNTTITVANVDSAFNIIANTGVPMGKGVYKVELKVNGAENIISTTTSIVSDNTDIDINGKLAAAAVFTRNENNELVSALNVTPSDIMIQKLALNLLPAEIINKGTRTEIHNFGIRLNDKRYFGIDGAISNLESDSLKVYFSHAEIGDLLEAFEIKNIRGCLHGNILLTNILDRPEMYTKGLEMSDIVIFSDTLGTMKIDSQWSDYFGGVRLDAMLNKNDENLAELDGTIYTIQDSLDLQLRLQEMPLKWVQPFVSDMLNKVDGTISTNLIIEGSSKAPSIRGFLGFNDTQIGVDYTNVVYTISDTIRVAPDRIGFDNLTIKDSRGSTATVNATVTHKNFNNMKYSLNMQMNNLMVLNTMHRTDSLFYGRVYATGNVKINGTNDGINMDMQIKNDKNSVLNILLPQHSEASDYKSVVYINVPEEKLVNSLKNLVQREAPLPIKLNIKLNVTPDIDLRVVIDQSTGDEMEAKGAGTIDFYYDMQSENMFARGDYALTDGKVKLNLQNIKKLDFKIRDGSKLYFKGDPLKTEFDITAYRRVRANLATLDNSFSVDGSNTKTNVDCILGIKGNMDKMDVTYNISLPEANDDIQRRVNTLISTEEQKIKNFASLVATGSFYVDMGGAGSSFGNSIWTNIASSALSSGLTALMGNVLGDKWQIGANIESNDGSVNDLNMTVNASTKLLDDKLKISTNLGYQTDQTMDNALIGDFDVEYQLNSMWTLRGYSHTNDQYYRTAPTTQGIGIVYTKEAATLKRLFQSFKPRRRNRNVQQVTDSTRQATDSTQQRVVPVQQPIINEEKNKEKKTDENRR